MTNRTGRKRIYLYLILAEILILLLLGIRLAAAWRTNQDMDISVVDLESDYINYDNRYAWYANEEIVSTQGEVNLISLPITGLKRGTYRAKIEYHCDQNQACQAEAESTQAFLLKSGRAVLSKNDDSIKYDFELREQVDDFTLRIKYNGQGYLQITNISVAPTVTGQVRDICAVFFLFICLDVCVVWSKKIGRHKNTLLALAGIAVLTSLPLSITGIGRGHDIFFHLMRIEGIAQELRLGNFPVKMSSLWMDGFGYPTSVYYGDLLLYVPAVMRLLGFSVTASYKSFMVLINLGTAVITYLCMKKIFQEEKIALLTSLIYCTSTYRLVDLYVRASVGEYSALMFLPIVALAVYKIYTEDTADYKAYRKNAVVLAIGMSGLIGTHILSMEMVVLILAVVSLSLFRLTFRKNTLKVYVTAVAETVIFSAYFVVPLLDYYVNIPTVINDRLNSKTYIQSWGTTVIDYFSFFRVDSAPLTPGLVLMAALIIAVVLWVNQKADKVMKALIIYSCLTLFIASNLFPWDYLISNYKIGIWMMQVQIPWRYIGTAAILLTLLLGRLMQQIRTTGNRAEVYGKVILLAGCLMTCFFIGNYRDDTEFIYFYDRDELNTYAVIGGEYIRGGTQANNLTNDIIYENMQEVSMVSRRGSSMELRCVSSEEEGTVCVPIFNYKGYHVKDDQGNEYLISDGENNQIQFSIPAGFDGTIRISYQEPWYWRAAELVSLAAVLGLCIWEGRKIHERKRLEQPG